MEGKRLDDSRLVGRCHAEKSGGRVGTGKFDGRVTGTDWGAFKVHLACDAQEVSRGPLVRAARMMYASLVMVLKLMTKVAAACTPRLLHHLWRTSSSSMCRMRKSTLYQ